MLFGKIANECKLLANYICKMAPFWTFDRILNPSMFM